MRITSTWIWITLHCVAACLPFFTSPTFQQARLEQEIAWPTSFRGRPLHRLPLSEKEQRFQKGFPGAIARFTDGERELIFRRILRRSRRVHPAQDCLRGSGYSISPLPLVVDREGKHWGCVQATRSEQSLQVCEQIYDDTGSAFSDVSTWYWASLLGKTEGPWWSVTIAETTSM